MLIFSIFLHNHIELDIDYLLSDTKADLSLLTKQVHIH